MDSDRDSSVNLGTEDSVILKHTASELCRLCANTDNQLIPIFKGDGLEHDIPRKLKKHLPIIKISEFDKLPLQICYQCASTLLAWHDLYEGCSLADGRLRSILAVEENDLKDEVEMDFDDDFRSDDLGESGKSCVDDVNILQPITSITEADKLLDLNNIECNDTQSSSDITVVTERENNNIDRCDARARRKRNPLRTDCGIDEKSSKTISAEQSTDGKGVTAANVSSSPSVVNPTFASFIVLPNQALPQTANPPRTILPRASSPSNKLPIARQSSGPVLLNPVTAIALNPISTVPLLIKLQPVNAVAAKSNVTEKKIASSKKQRSSNLTSSKENKDSDKQIKLSHNNEFILPSDTSMHSCNYCDYRCKRKYDIKRHIVCMHMSTSSKMELEVEKLVCSICDRSFQNKVTLRKHVIKSHFKSEQRPTTVNYCFCCDICHEGFYSQKQLLAHHDVVHSHAAPMTWLSFRSARRCATSCEQCKRNYKESKFPFHSCTPLDEITQQKMERALKCDPKYKCDSCSLCFSWKWLYRKHRENMHPAALILNWENVVEQIIPNYCGYCFLALDEEETNHRCIDNGSEKETTFKTHTCSLCKTSYVRKADFYRHMRAKHPLDFDGKEDLIAKRKTTSINCPYCEETGVNKIVILEHIRTAHNIDIGTPFICLPCNKLFKRKSTLDTHNQIYHPREQSEEEASRILKESEILLNGDKAFHCGICNRNMFDSIRFMAHYRLHNIERRFTCDLCGKQTRTQHQLNSHIKFIHLNIRNHECDICGKSFHAKQACEEHRRIHTGEKPFSCEICGKTFVAMNALFTHQKFHNDFFAHSCHLCPKKFKIRRSLTNHIRTHTGERPFKCDLCSKTFNNSSRFSYHMRVTHSDNRPFTCSKCGSCFKANRFLTRHLKLHDKRTHIQFRRRNNPAYFATQKTSTGGKGSDSPTKKRRVELSSDSDHTKYAATTDVSDEEIEELFDDDKRCKEEITISELDFA